jgi:hypothetical protein
MKRRTVVLALVGAFWMDGIVQGSAIRTGFDSFSLPKDDDASSPATSLGFTLDLFGAPYTSLYVNTNGNVTFKPSNHEFTPFGLQGEVGTPILAPFFADVDTRATASAVVRYGPGVVDGHNAFGVNWIDVGYFFKHADKLNSFQLILIDRSDRHPGDADVEFNYGRLLWESGDWSGGVNGLGGLSARAGYSNGTGLPGTSYELPGSGVPGSFLDSSATGLIHHSYNSPVPGRYVFAVLHSPPPVVPAPGALVLSGIGLGLVHRLRGRRILESV